MRLDYPAPQIIRNIYHLMIFLFVLSSPIFSGMVFKRLEAPLTPSSSLLIYIPAQAPLMIMPTAVISLMVATRKYYLLFLNGGKNSSLPTARWKKLYRKSQLAYLPIALRFVTNSSISLPSAKAAWLAKKLFFKGIDFS